MTDHIDPNVLVNATGATDVKLDMRLKDGSFYTLHRNHKTQYFADTPWLPAPIFRDDMTCPGGDHQIMTDDDCCVCHDTADAGATCSHMSTVCGECIETWACDFYFRITLDYPGVPHKWYGLNDVPGYQPL